MCYATKVPPSKRLMAGLGAVLQKSESSITCLTGYSRYSDLFHMNSYQLATHTHKHTH